LVVSVGDSHCLFDVHRMEVYNQSLEYHLLGLESVRVLANDFIDIQAIVNKMGEKMLWRHCPASMRIAVHCRYHRISRMAISGWPWTRPWSTSVR
jgi:hypothetical protein